MADRPIELGSLEAMGRPSHESRRTYWLLTRDFGWLWWGQLISQVGDGVTRLALLWFVYSVTGSPLQTTIIGLLQTLPPIVFGPLIGVYLDRLPKKSIMIGSDLARAVIIGVVPCWVTTDTLTVGYLYTLVFLNSIVSTAFGPALIASVPFIVRRGQFTAANALLQITSSVGVIAGSALSGIGIAALSSQRVLCVNAVTYLASAACLLFVRLPYVAESRPKAGHRFFSTMQDVRDLIEGFHFSYRQHTILLLIITSAIYSFGMSAFSTLFPILGKNMLKLGPADVGYLWSALGGGLFLVSVALVWLSYWDLQKRMSAIAFSSALTGVALWGLAIAGDIVVEGLLMGIIGAGIGLFTPVAWGVLQEIVPDRLVGRVLTIYGAGAMAAAMLGMMAFAWVMQQLGERGTVIGIGLVTIATTAMAWHVGQCVREEGTTT